MQTMMWKRLSTFNNAYNLTIFEKNYNVIINNKGLNIYIVLLLFYSNVSIFCYIILIQTYKTRNAPY